MNERVVESLCESFNKEFSREKSLPRGDCIPRNACSVNHKNQMIYFDTSKNLYLIEGGKVRQLFCDMLDNYRQYLLIEEIAFNKTGEFFYIHCEKSVYVYKLPSKHDDNVCQGFCVGESYEFSKASVFVEKVRWNHLSAYHLVILTSDNKLKMYNLTKDHQYPEHSVRLGGRLTTKKEKMVSFTFGRGRNWEFFCVFCCSNLGNVYCVCPFIPIGCYVHRRMLDKISENQREVQYVKSITHSFHKDLILTKRSREPTSVILLSQAFPEGTKKEDVAKERSFFERKFCSDITILYDEKGYYSLVCLINIMGHVKTYLLLDEIRPFIERIDYLCHSLTDLGLPKDLYENVNKYGYPSSDDIIRPFFLKHPTDQFSSLVCHIGGVHEMCFPFLNDIERTNDRVKKFDNFYHSYLVQTFVEKGVMNVGGRSRVKVKLEKDVKYSKPVRGISVIPNVFHGYCVLVVDWINQIHKYYIKSFVLQDPPFVSSELLKMKKKNDRKEIEGILKRNSFDEVFRRVQSEFERIPQFLSLGKSKKYEFDEIDKIVKLFSYRHFRYIDTVCELIRTRIVYILELQKKQKSDFDKIKDALKQQLEKIEGQKKRIKQLHYQQKQIDAKKDRILSVLSKVRPISLEERTFFEFVKDLSITVDNWKKQIGTIEKVSGENLKVLRERAELAEGNKGLESFNVEEMKKNVKNTYGDVQKSVENLAGLEKEINEFKQEFE